MADVFPELLRDPQLFNLFQAIRLLERAAPEKAPVGTSVGIDEAVRLAGDSTLAFAPSAIASLRASIQDGPPWTLRTAAMTLAGAQGPLPTPLTELLLEQRSARAPAGLDFLDIFNGRLLGLWQRARSKHHVALHPEATPPQLRTLDALSGLGRAEGAHGPAGELGWLRHAGLQGAAPRSMASLLALLRDRLGVPFEGTQFVGGWHALAPSERACLRSQGKGRTLGARFWDQAAGMALSAPPLTMAAFTELLPGGARFALMGWLVARHLQAEFTVTLTLTLAEAPATRLDGELPRLGRSAWLSSRAGAAATYRPVRWVLAAPGVNLAKG
jgi:type VI secretion system protein ImpH